MFHVQMSMKSEYETWQPVDRYDPNDHYHVMFHSQTRSPPPLCLTPQDRCQVEGVMGASSP